MSWQHTLREKLYFEGPSLHDGKFRRLELLPAAADTGIVFVRSDALATHPPAEELAAHIGLVRKTELATTLARGHGANFTQVATVEHLLAAFAGVGVDNARVLVDGPELPIMDGSAKPFADGLLAAGLETQAQRRRVVRIRREVAVQDGPKWAKFSPAAQLSIRCSLDFDHPLIGEGAFFWQHQSADAFARDIAPARTFGFVRDVAALKAQGLILGGSLANAVVIDDYTVLNPEGLRFADEFVRHKVLDALGDMALFGMPVVGKLQLHRSGHGLHAQLIRAVLEDPRNYEVVRLTARSKAALGGRHPDHDAAFALDACAPAHGFLGATKGLA